MVRKTVLFVFCILIVLSTAHAQSNYSAVSGSVLDQQHRPIVGARVHIKASETGAQR